MKKTRTLQQMKKALKRAAKRSTADDVCSAWFVSGSVLEELKCYTPKNKRQETKKAEIQETAERLRNWAGYWAARIA